MKREEQISFANAGFDRYARTTKRAQFLDEMDTIVPWDQLCEVIRPHYPTGEGGRPPIAPECFASTFFSSGSI